MPIYLKDLLQNPGLLPGPKSAQQCVVCRVQLQETITGKRETPAGCACSDCYYERLGQEIEKHPIASAGIRRS